MYEPQSGFVVKSVCFVLILMGLSPMLFAQSPPIAFKDARGTKEKCECLLQWTGQLPREYPSLNLRGTAVNRIYSLAINLFADEYFVPVFDKPYDQLNASTRNRIGKALQNCTKQSEYQASFSWQAYPVVNPLTLETGNMSFETTARMVVEQRSLRAAYYQLMQEIRQIPASQAGYERLQAISRTSQRQFQQLWPSEQQALTDLIAENQGLLAEATLREQLAQLIAQGDSYNKALQLQQFVQQQSRYFQEITPAAKRDLQTGQQQALTAVLRQLMTQEQSVIDGFSGTIGDLETSNQWHDRFRQSYKRNFQNPEIDETYAYFIRTRQQLLEGQFPQIEAAFGQTRDFARIDQLKKNLLHVPLNDPTLAQRIEQAAARRKQLIKSANLGKPAYAWYQARESARGISPGELINRIESVAIEAGSLEGEIARTLTALGKRVDSTSLFKVIFESDQDFLTYTSTHVTTGQIVQQADINAYSFEAHLVINGEVYREGLIMSNQLILASGVISRIKKSGDYLSLAQSRAADVDLVVRQLFENNNNYQDPALSDEAWQQLLQSRYGEVEQVYDVYQRARAISPTNNLYSLKEIGDFQGIHKQSQAIPGLEAFQALKQNQMMQFMDDLFLRGRTFENDWNPRRRWSDGLAAINIPILTDNRNPALPVITQEISGTSLNMGGSGNATGHALMSRSYLTEPNCLVPMNGQFYRVTGTTLSHIRIKYTADELMAGIVELTNQSIQYFSRMLMRYNPNGSGGAVAYEPRPSSHSFRIQGYERSNIQVEKGDKIELHADGSINFGLFAGSGGPAGIGGFTQYNQMPGHKHGALLMRIGNGDWIAVGSQRQVIVQQSGTLTFMVNDSDTQNNQGQFTVTANVFKQKQ